MDHFQLKPIGFLHCKEEYPQTQPRQAVKGDGNTAVIELKSLFPLIQAAEDIKTCSKIWLIYLFHKNKTWNPKVYPPRGSDKKIGVLATRAPYRPNPIGLSCVDVVKVEKNKIYIKNHDLLNQTPILDIKPYLSYSDSFEGVEPAWIQKEEKYELIYSTKCMEKMKWLSESVQTNFETLLKDQLTYQPFYSKRKRMKEVGENHFVYSFRTWRFDLEFHDNRIIVQDLFSGYTPEEISDLLEDPYKDKKLHQKFVSNFQIKTAD